MRMFSKNSKNVVVKSALSKELTISLRKMISPLVRSATDIDDIIQEILLKIHKKGDSVEPSKFTAWLYQVSRTTTIDYYRKNKSYLSLNDQNIEDISSTSDDMINNKNQLIECIHPLLKKLDPSDQQVIAEVDLSGRSQMEMADKIGLKYSTLKSKVQRARQKLKEEILSCCKLEMDGRKRPVSTRQNKSSTCC